VQSDQWEWFEKSVEEAEWVKYVNAIRIEVSAKSAAVRGGRGRSASWHFNFKPKGGQAFRFSATVRQESYRGQGRCRGPREHRADQHYLNATLV